MSSLFTSSSSLPFTSFQGDIYWHGVDWNGPTPVNADNTTVTRVNVPSARSSVPDIAWEELQHSVDRMEQSEHYAFDLYERARAILLSNL